MSIGGTGSRTREEPLPKLLIVAADYPFPADHGFKIRVADMCLALGPHVEQHLLVHRSRPQPEALPREDFFGSVSFVPQPEPPTGFRRWFQRLGDKLDPPHFDHPRYTSEELRRRVVELHEEHNFDGCLVHTPLLAGCLNALPPDVKTVIDTHDLWHEKHRLFRRLGYGHLLHHCRSRDKELDAYAAADLALAISLYDQQVLADAGMGPDHVLHVPVSFDARPLPRNCEEPTLLYAAGVGIFNVDAVYHFVDRVLPRVQWKVPGAKLQIMGAGPKIKERYSQRSDIVLLPYLEDVTQAYESSQVVVVPLRYGTGLKIKVLESFSYGCPTVLTEAAAQGVALDDYPQESFSSDPGLFAKEVVHALTSADQRDALSYAGLDAIEKHYNRGAVYDLLIQRLGELLRSRRRSPVYSGFRAITPTSTS